MPGVHRGPLRVLEEQWKSDRSGNVVHESLGSFRVGEDSLEVLPGDPPGDSPERIPLGDPLRGFPWGIPWRFPRGSPGG